MDDAVARDKRVGSKGRLGVSCQRHNQRARIFKQQAIGLPVDWEIDILTNTDDRAIDRPICLILLDGVIDLAQQRVMAIKPAYAAE